jgi:hypothetical protein
MVSNPDNVLVKILRDLQIFDKNSRVIDPHFHFPDWAFAEKKNPSPGT